MISIVVKIGNLLIIQQFDQSERSAISCNLCRGKSNTLRSPHSAGYKSEFLLLQPSLWIPKASLWPDPPPRPFTWFPLITQSLPISDPPPRRVIKGFSLNEQYCQGHHQLSPEKSNLNQGRLTYGPLPRTIIQWCPPETIWFLIGWQYHCQTMRNQIVSKGNHWIMAHQSASWFKLDFSGDN